MNGIKFRLIVLTRIKFNISIMRTLETKFSTIFSLYEKWLDILALIVLVDWKSEIKTFMSHSIVTQL